MNLSKIFRCIVQNNDTECAENLLLRGSVQPQIDQQNRNVGGGNAADTRGLSDGGGTSLGELLRGLNAQSLYLLVVKGARELS